MFKQRLITALILTPLVLLALYYSNLTCFKIFSVVVLIACGIEWCKLIPLTSRTKTLIFLSLLLIIMVFLPTVFEYALILGCILWFLILIALLLFPKSLTLWGHPSFVIMLAMVLLPLFIISLVQIYQMTDGKALILYLLLLVWGADIGAYLSGKLCGKHKLIPAVSPGKTIEGLIGGVLLSGIVALLAYPYFHFYNANLGHYQLVFWLLMAVVVFIMALIGDLFISMLKRRVHLKDTGNLFPGHGGVLDRLDSLIAAAPIFYVLISTLSQGT